MSRGFGKGSGRIIIRRLLREDEVVHIEEVYTHRGKRTTVRWVPNRIYVGWVPSGCRIKKRILGESRKKDIFLCL